MFRDLPWRQGFRKAAIFIVIWAVLIYFMNIAFPETFGLNSEDVPGFAVNGVMFFFVFAFFFAWTEKRRNQRIEELKNRKKNERPGRPAGDDGDDGRPESAFKGKPNPNTSRKKARRRR